MSTTTRSEAIDSTETEPVAPSMAERIFTALQQANEKKPAGEQDRDAVLWRRARIQARKDWAREGTKQAARSAATTAYAESRSLIHRNRAQLAPWLISAPFAATGETVNLLATYSDGNPVAISAAAAATTAGSSLLAWRKKLARRIPARFRQKAQAGLAMLCGWTASMPFVPTTDQAGMWLALLGGTAWLSLSWWKEHDHPIPTLQPTPLDQDQEQERDEGPEAGTQGGFGQQVLADWEAYVSGQNILAGSHLSRPRRISNGWSFLLHLVRGKQQLDDARSAKNRIATALNLDPSVVSFDLDNRPGADRNTIVLTVLTETVDNTYTGPVITRDDGEVCIEIGPYEDGHDSERFHVLSDQLSDAELAAGKAPRGSMNGGFVLGTKGSGKSRLLELIAIGLRQLGVEIWYLDPQEGKSSPAITAEADWPLAGLHGTKGAYSNVVDLWQAITAACEVREAEGVDEPGFQHTRKRPAIMVIIDECHQVFQADNPETGVSFGQDFADLDRIMRKNGVGLLCASQSITQDTFGRGNKAAVLRDGVSAVNVFLMAYGGKNLRLAPGYDDQPCGDLPLNRGYGYNPRGARPQMRWQSRHLEEPQPWLAAYPPATLDQRVQKRIGAAYLHRFETAQENHAAKQAWLDRLDAAEGDASTVPSLWQDGGQASPQQQPQQPLLAAVPSLLSPHQQRAAQDEADEAATAVLTGAEQTALEALSEQAHTPTTLGEQLQVSSQAAGRHLRRLAEKGVAERHADGAYVALD